ncbi:MAG: hypothetical protein HKM95_09775 [Inquilinus sp.]|nr:hypothetical protein [Inquilinus sp.]
MALATTIWHGAPTRSILGDFRMGLQPSKQPDWHRRLTREVRRRRIKVGLWMALALVPIMAILAALYLDERRPIGQIGGTAIGVRQVQSQFRAPATKTMVRLDDGRIVQIGRVPDYLEGARVIVEEDVSLVFRLHRFRFVAHEVTPQ